MTPPYYEKIAKPLLSTAPEDRRIIFNLPPQHGKSETITKTFPAFWHGHHPDDWIILGAYNSEMAKGFANDNMNIMRSKEYQ